jgi:hypothetical protein
LAVIKLLVAPLRRLARFPLFQLALAIAAVLLLQAADSGSLLGRMFSTLDWLVDLSVRQCAALFEVRSFTRSWLTMGFMIAYVYLIGLALVHMAKAALRAATAQAARWNVLGLRDAIARERGIVAYRAWLPLEEIRPAHVTQQQWEESFAWPADGNPPYPPLAHRMTRVVLTYAAAALVVLVLLQAFTPFPALTWLGERARTLVAGG